MGISTVSFADCFSFLKYCGGKQRRYLLLVDYVPFLPSSSFHNETGIKFQEGNFVQ